MCGIAGWVDWERNLSAEHEIVARMGQTLFHRGPDAPGLWTSVHAAFAHQRLIVVDPDGGIQPMTKRLGEHSFTIVYNGELYNTEDIRRDLRALGYTFESYSDTEVLLTSYLEWGCECVDHFNGIFAFAIWDDCKQRLFMARDRLGVKPLFYAERGSSFLFASELKAILAHPDVEPVIDAEGLAEIFAIGPARTPGHGVFKHIHELRAGHRLVATKDSVRVLPYWKLESHPHEESIEQTISHVRELMIDIVTRQLISDVPIATFLSGGLDSSAVSAIAAEAIREAGKPPLNTYSIEFLEMDKHFAANDFQKSLDGPWARRVSKYANTTHHSIVFDTPDLADAILAPLAARDLPGMADIDTSLYLFCRRIKQDVTVALSGESADEVFGGYPWFHRTESLEAHTFPWSLRLHERIRMMSGELKSVINPTNYVHERYAEALSEVPRLNGESASEARVREIGYLSITRFLPTLLDRKDRMSMASGLEVRVPFCDHRLVQYVFNLPWTVKTSGGHIKGILRQAMEGYLPDDALYRKKSPYPSTPNPEYLSLTRKLALDILTDSDAPILPFIDQSALVELANQSQAPMEHRPWFGQIMAVPQMFHYLYETNEWMKQYGVRVQ